MGKSNALNELLDQTRSALAWLRNDRPDLPTLDLDEHIGSPAELAAALRGLYAAPLERDEAEDTCDRDSGTFLFFDAGLASVLEKAESSIGNRVEA